MGPVAKKRVPEMTKDEIICLSKSIKQVADNKKQISDQDIYNCIQIERVKKTQSRKIGPIFSPENNTVGHFGSSSQDLRSNEKWQLFTSSGFL